MFHIGERVVHPLHGVGTIANLVDKDFESGQARRYYEITMADSTLWVPVDAPSLGLRRLSSKSELTRCKQILQGSPSVSELDPRQLRDALSKHLRDGSVAAQCEVLRDVTALGWKKPLVGALAELRRVAFNVLCEEWAAVAGVPLTEATDSINACLGVGRQAFHS